MPKTEPLICIDEKNLQLINHSRAPLRMAVASPTKQDYEYVRNGTTNLFVAVQPKGGKRIVSVTERLGKIDFVAFITVDSTRICNPKLMRGSKPAKPSAPKHRVELYSSGCGSNAGTSPCFVI